MAGVCDLQQRLCFTLSLWNRQDPILKERIFGLTGNEGNHGEDAKEHWWYVDSTPTHSWMRGRYYYPQDAYPYDALVAENRGRSRDEPEFEIDDTGVLDDGYWVITVDYAKASPNDLCILIEVANRGAGRAELDVLPTLTFRNTWSWGLDGRTPSLRPVEGKIEAEHWELGTYRLEVTDGPDGPPELLFCDNETNYRRLCGEARGSQYPKDGINDPVIHDTPTVNADRTGTKARRATGGPSTAG